MDDEQEPIPSMGTPLTLTIVGEARRPEDYIQEAADRTPQVYLGTAFGTGTVPPDRSSAPVSLAPTRPGNPSGRASVCVPEAIVCVYSANLRPAVRPRGH
jgi:hypothetical protein